MTTNSTTTRQIAILREQLRRFTELDPGDAAAVKGLQAEAAATLAELSRDDEQVRAEFHQARARAGASGYQSRAQEFHASVIGQLRALEREGHLPDEIARRMNAAGKKTYQGKNWSRGTVLNALKPRA